MKQNDGVIILFEKKSGVIINKILLFYLKQKGGVVINKILSVVSILFETKRQSNYCSIYFIWNKKVE